VLKTNPLFLLFSVKGPYLELGPAAADAVNLKWQSTLLADWLIHQPVLTNRRKPDMYQILNDL
jgi:hypothetical protein